MSPLELILIFCVFGILGTGSGVVLMALWASPVGDMIRGIVFHQWQEQQK